MLNSYASGSATTTTLVSSQNPAKLGASVTFTATVTTTGANQPTGLVNLLDGATNIGSSTLTTVGSSQEVMFTFAGTLAAGTHSITAAYAGDTDNAASTSSVLTQVITPPTFTWTSNGSTTGTALSGQSATYNFTAKPTSDTTFAASVAFSCSGLPDATITCSFNPPQINAGSGTTPVQLTVTTTGPNAPPGPRLERRTANHSPWLPVVFPLVGIAAICFAGRKKLKRSAIAGLCVPLVLLALLVACGGGSNSTPPPVVGVSVGQGVPASVFPNNAADGWPTQSAQFSATVTNTTNTAVTWAVTTANGGSIDANGVYTPPTIAAGLPTSVTITATSAADPSKSGSATEKLTAATVPGNYVITVTAAESTATNSAQVMLGVQ